MDSKKSLRHSYAHESYGWHVPHHSEPSPVTHTPSVIAVPDDGDTTLTDLLKSFSMQYTSTAIAMPWEVARTLLQVQYLPKESTESAVEEDGDESSEGEEDETDDSYFADPDATPTIPTPPTALRPLPKQQEQPTSPLLPPTLSPLGLLRNITNHPNEGYTSLFKALLTSTITDALSSFLQPTVHNLISAIFLQSLHSNALVIPITSHILTGLLLSPLDIVRTRLIVQSASPPPSNSKNSHTHYSGPLDALTRLPPSRAFTSSTLLIPTLLEHTIRPLLALTLPTLIANAFHLHPYYSNTAVWGLVELGSSALGLLITLPIETVRKRLQIQAHEQEGELYTCIRVRPRPYVGVVDCMYRIVKEEQGYIPLPPAPVPRKLARSMSSSSRKMSTSSASQVQVQEQQSWLNNTGIPQLYRGLKMRLIASLIVFVLGVVAGPESGERDSGWAEL
ncbi:hypothetical protein VNI00_001981 [Paramarasmius palmivorus]|uniref:Mitochondrial carrier n=1 Tax=Paramarasmius palmivorus TaxID=297713 RepID=A0AAW0E2I0_9AGAR